MNAITGVDTTQLSRTQTSDPYQQPYRQMSFAVALVRNGPGTRNDYAFTNMMFNVSSARDGNVANNSFSAIPGSAWVINPGRNPVRVQP